MSLLRRSSWDVANASLLLRLLKSDEPPKEKAGVKYLSIAFDLCSWSKEQYAIWLKQHAVHPGQESEMLDCHLQMMRTVI